MTRDGALTAATRDLCGEDAVFLGENTHGDGETVAFKADLVQRLVRTCRFNAVFFEASHYEFLEISRRLRAGETVSSETIATAIGRLWSRDGEIAPLIPFLQAQSASGRVTLGGLDNQLGGMDQVYSNETMPQELTSYLGEPRRAACRELFRRRINWDYSPSAPETPAERDRLQQCLADIGRATAAEPSLEPTRRDELLDIVENATRDIGRDLMDRDAFVRERDETMWLNLKQLAARLPPHSKIIVWTATAHAAKDGGLDPVYTAAPNLGRYAHQAYGPHAFVLGFTATSGAYRWSRTQARPIPPPPLGSLEARALPAGAGEAAYVDPAELRAMGRAPAALSGHEYRIVDLGNAVDGVVVFQVEHPPTRPD